MTLKQQLNFKCVKSDIQNTYLFLVELFCCVVLASSGRVLWMGDLAADRPVWWRWAYLGLWQSSSQLQMISPTLARWRWAYLGSAVLKPAKSLIADCSGNVGMCLLQKTDKRECRGGAGTVWCIHEDFELLPAIQQVQKSWNYDSC